MDDQDTRLWKFKLKEGAQQKEGWRRRTFEPA